MKRAYIKLNTETKAIKTIHSINLTILSRWFLYFKAFHIVGAVAWFAGLFYLVRMFVYHVESDQNRSIYAKLSKTNMA
ncbi:MAG: CopD family protein [Spirosomataceae bacterium]